MFIFVLFKMFTRKCSAAQKEFRWPCNGFELLLQLRQPLSRPITTLQLHHSFITQRLNKMNPSKQTSDVFNMEGRRMDGRHTEDSALRTRKVSGDGRAGTTGVVNPARAGGSTLSASIRSYSQLSPERTPPKLRRSAKDRAIEELEMEVERWKEKCESYEARVHELQGTVTQLTIKKSTKKELRKAYAWEEVDSTYASAISRLAKEFLFPRFKFLHGQWMDYSDKKGSLTLTILRHCPPPVGRNVKDTWDRVIAPTVATKYATMRNNVNNAVRAAFKGEYTD